MAKKNISTEFNAFAGKIINQNDVDSLMAKVKVEKPKGFKRVLKTAKTIVMLPVNIVMFPVRISRMVKAGAKYMESLPKNPTIYVRKEKEEIARAALLQATGMSKASEDIVTEAVGASNVYIEADRYVGLIRMAMGPFSKSLVKRFETAVAKAPDYSADLKAGKIVALKPAF